MNEPQTVAYLRVSDISQADDDKTGFARQLQTIQEYVTKNDLNLTKEYQEVATGTESSRPVFNQMLDELPPQSTILIECMDRFSRSTMHGLPHLMEMVATGHNLIECSSGESLTEAMNGHPMQQALVELRLVMSTFEKGMISHRLRKGRERKAQERGYYKTRTPKHSDRFRQRLRDMRDSGKTYQAIADTLNREGKTTATGLKWTPPHVASAMKNGGTKS